MARTTSGSVWAASEAQPSSRQLVPAADQSVDVLGSPASSTRSRVTGTAQAGHPESLTNGVRKHAGQARCPAPVPSADRRLHCVEGPQDAELVALGIAHHHPVGVRRLTDLYTPCAELFEPCYLRGLVRRTQVQVKPVLAGLALRYQQEQQVGNNTVLSQRYQPAARVPLRRVAREYGATPEPLARSWPSSRGRSCRCIGTGSEGSSRSTLDCGECAGPPVFATITYTYASGRRQGPRQRLSR
jgi:hypothetical protein